MQQFLAIQEQSLAQIAQQQASGDTGEAMTRQNAAYGTDGSISPVGGCRSSASRSNDVRPSTQASWFAPCLVYADENAPRNQLSRSTSTRQNQTYSANGSSSPIGSSGNSRSYGSGSRLTSQPSWSASIPGNNVASIRTPTPSFYRPSSQAGNRSPQPLVQNRTYSSNSPAQPARPIGHTVPQSVPVHHNTPSTFANNAPHSSRTNSQPTVHYQAPRQTSQTTFVNHTTRPSASSSQTSYRPTVHFQPAPRPAPQPMVTNRTYTPNFSSATSFRPTPHVSSGTTFQRRKAGEENGTAEPAQPD